MRKLFSILVFLAGSLSVNAQSNNYDDLKILYADGNYEKLAKVAEGYTNKDDLKKDPIPFIWLARGLYKVSLSGTDDERFKNAYKDAISALAKALKNDKDGTKLSDFQEFIDEFQMSLVEKINNDLTAKDYSKASSWATKYAKITNNTAGAKYVEGAMKYRKADKTGANVSWKDADALLAKTENIDNWSEADKLVMKYGVFQTAECYIAMRQNDKAKALVDKVAPWYEEDADFKAKYDELFK